MEFTLHYSGDLKTNAGRVQKHSIRKAFHIQMKELWNHEPLRDRKGLIEEHKSSIGNFNFVPLIIEKMGMTVEVDIVMLRPGKPGKIVIEGGDIDTRGRPWVSCGHLSSLCGVLRSSPSSSRR